MRTLLVIFLSTFSFILAAQQTYPCFSVVDSFSVNSTLAIGSTIWIVEDQVWIDEEENPTAFIDVFYFQKRIKLEAYFKCSYLFEAFGSSGEFSASRVQLSNGSLMYLVQQANNAFSYFIYFGEQYLLRPCNDEEQCTTDKYIQSKITEQTINYSIRPDEVTIINFPAEFGSYTEQVLEHDAYNNLNVTQAVYDTIPYGFVIKENSSCLGDTNFIYVEDSILIQSSYDSLIVVPPVFEVVTEQVLEKESYAFYNVRERELIDTSLEIILLPEYNILVWDTLSNCISDEPSECLTFDTITIDESKFDIDVIIAGDCANSETPCGPYCLKFVEVPATYVTREYTRLVVPALVEIVQIPAQYYYYTRQELATSTPDSCIYYTLDTIDLLQFSEPAIVTDTEVPAEYSTRVFERVESPAFFEKEILQTFNTSIDGYVLEQNLATEEQFYICEQFLDEDLRQKIIDRLVQIGFLSQQTEFGSDLFWQAVFNYQQEHELSLGKIDLVMINTLGIE